MARVETTERMRDELAELVATGTAPWVRCWDVGAGNGPLRDNGVPFTRGNAVWLHAIGAARGYGCRTWLTFNQARKAGTPVTRGARSATVLLPLFLTDDDGERRIRGYRSYSVFNGSECSGWMDPITEPREVPEPTGLLAKLAAVWGGVRHEGNAAYYAPGPDTVTLPPRESFRSLAAYMGTLAHEKAHQSGHRSRLNRDGVANPAKFGDHTYAEEELVAESAAAFVLGIVGLATDDLRTNSAAYLRHWLKATRDPQILHRAMGHGIAAAEYLLKAAA